MIVGIGVDVLEVERMRGSIERYQRRFLDHVFSPEEQAGAPVGAGQATYYAGRWAAKEAISKALGVGIGASCGWKEICVLRGPAGAPTASLSGAAAQTAARLGADTIHISISHERTLACASAVAEKLEK